MLVRSICFTAGVSTLGLLGVACTDDGNPLVVRQNNAPGEDSCIVAPELNAVSLTRGHVDTRGGAPFYLTPLVQNYASSNGGALTAQRTILVEGARVDINFVDTDLFSDAEQADLDASGLTRFETRFSVPVDPDEGLATFGFELVQSGLLEELDAKLEVGQTTLLNTTTTVFGTMGGGGVESQLFPYTVEVCKGCLSVDAGSCPLPYDTTLLLGDTCGGGAITCCDDGGTLVCPAELADPPA
jgi:hypothetical protein